MQQQATGSGVSKPDNPEVAPVSKETWIEAKET
jgi:hypothetical protein